MKKHLNLKHCVKIIVPKTKQKKIKKKPFKCEQCPYVTNRRADLSRHHESHSSKSVIKNKFKIFSIVHCETTNILEEINGILNEMASEDAIRICGKKILTVGPKLMFLNEYAATHENNDHLIAALTDIQKDAKTTAAAISQMIISIESNIGVTSEGDDIMEEDDDEIEVPNLGVLKKTLVIDTNIYMHFPSVVEHIFQNRK